MKQIKTIRRADPEDFDRDVNKAIAEGWSLNKRYLSDVGFIAELEREVVTEEQAPELERCCGNCKHADLTIYDPPCCSCHDNDKWEKVIEEKERCCGNCKHVSLHGFELPCGHCDVYSKWEPQT